MDKFPNFGQTTQNQQSKQIPFENIVPQQSQYPEEQQQIPMQSSSNNNQQAIFKSQQQANYIPQQQSYNGFYMQQIAQPSPSFLMNSNNFQFCQQTTNNFTFEQIQQVPYQTSDLNNVNYQQQVPNFQLPYGHHDGVQTIRLLYSKEESKDKEVVAVIVTLHSGGSYDELFSTVEQKSLEGTRVLVYQTSSGYVQKLIRAFEGQPQDDTAKEMMEHIKKIHPDCVVFNWECCGGYSSQHFHEGKDNVFKFLKMILDKGHMAMFSDFSLKALIQDWDSTLLGPNPFVRTGQTSSPFEMRFKPGQLKQCPSAQLQIIGQMAEQGKCNVSVLGGTILYSVDLQNTKHNHYKTQILSIAANCLPHQPKYQLHLDEFKGSASHVLLTYPSGGMILTSMGHWIQLMKVDTSQKKLFEVAEKNFGAEYAQQMKNQYANLGESEQQAWVSSNAVKFVQNQAPCSNMSKKAKW